MKLFHNSLTDFGENLALTMSITVGDKTMKSKETQQEPSMVIKNPNQPFICSLIAFILKLPASPL